MKIVACIIRPQRLEAVKEALLRFGVSGLTVIDVHGVGRQRGHTEVYRGHEYQVDLVTKVRIEVAVPDDKVDDLVDLVAATARTGASGQIGDGKIFVQPLEEAVRIRTGERGDSAL
jgi:nitrogen regulatory protein P-II 1